MMQEKAPVTLSVFRPSGLPPVSCHSPLCLGESSSLLRPHQCCRQQLVIHEVLSAGGRSSVRAPGCHEEQGRDSRTTDVLVSFSRCSAARLYCFLFGCLLVLKLPAGAEVVQEADARLVASFGRGQRRIVGFDRVRGPVIYLFCFRE